MPRRRPFRRTDRLNRQIRDLLAVCLQRGTREEALRGVVVTGVEVTRDLSLARVYYYVMSGDRDEIAEALARAGGYLRSQVGQGVRMRHVPELRWEYDVSIDRGRRVEEILKDLDLPPAEDEEPDEDTDTPGEGDAG